MNKFVIILITLLLSACSLGPDYSIIKDKINSVPTENVARIVFFRTTESVLYAARSAPINIDGQKIGSVMCRDFLYKDVAEGKHILKTELWDMPGKCEITLNAKADNIYYFQVDSRSQSFWAFMAGGIIGNAIESSGKECGGAFKLYPNDPETAKIKLIDLRLSE